MTGHDTVVLVPKNAGRSADDQHPRHATPATNEENESMRAKRVLIGLAAMIASITGSVISAPAASAATIHGCPEVYFCFYFNSNYEGARADYLRSDGNLENETFNKGGSNGQGVQVKNNAASVVNNWSYTATVYYNSGCNGSFASQSFGTYSASNFNAVMKNENASFRWPESWSVYSDCANRDQF
ncbi:peptidase inhibitor family I36 protein [Actinosynnema sp. CS-041913]|uniref:peptidase inhibitor family I36 protein n=1 Tax=Actinosynnema sp. CS-041913 TaxID=3239917 RepID=UPI003D8E807C